MREIFFLSDFGLVDVYVALVKQAMRRIASDLQIHDLTHAVAPHDLRAAAYQLYQAVPYLPDGAVVLAVVDPGVGSERRAVVVRGEHLWYVVPDNGLLTLAAIRDTWQNSYLLEAAGMPLISNTFHGRDLFGPAAARLAMGERGFLGEVVQLSSLVHLPLSISEGPQGEILTFDRFGNAITTLRIQESPVDVWTAGRRFTGVSYYAEGAKDEPLALMGSSGLLELALYQGNAQEALGLKVGMLVRQLKMPS